MGGLLSSLWWAIVKRKVILVRVLSWQNKIIVADQYSHLEGFHSETISFFLRKRRTCISSLGKWHQWSTSQYRSKDIAKIGTITAVAVLLVVAVVAVGAALEVVVFGRTHNVGVVVMFVDARCKSDFGEEKIVREVEDHWTLPLALPLSDHDFISSS